MTYHISQAKQPSRKVLQTFNNIHCTIIVIYHSVYYESSPKGIPLNVQILYINLDYKIDEYRKGKGIRSYGLIERT